MNQIFDLYQRMARQGPLPMLWQYGIARTNNDFPYGFVGRGGTLGSWRIAPLPEMRFRGTDDVWVNTETAFYMTFLHLPDGTYQWRIGIAPEGTPWEEIGALESPIQSEPDGEPKWPWEIGGWSCEKKDGFIAAPSEWVNRSGSTSVLRPALSEQYGIAMTDGYYTWRTPAIYEKDEINPVAWSEPEPEVPAEKNPFGTAPTVYTRFYGDPSINATGTLNILHDSSTAWWIEMHQNTEVTGFRNFLNSPTHMSSPMELSDLKWPWEVRFADWTGGGEPTAFSLDLFSPPEI